MLFAFLGVVIKKTGAMTDRAVALIVGLMYEPNALAMQVALETGLRISDVLSLRTKQIKQKTFTVTEQKTGKKRKIKLSDPLKASLMKISGVDWVFPHRTEKTKHRTRQAVWKDIKRVEGILYDQGYLQQTDVGRHSKNNTGPVVGTHSGRKTYARRYYDDTQDFDGLRQRLNHQRDEITVVYLMSQMIDIRPGRRKRPEKSS